MKEMAPFFFPFFPSTARLREMEMNFFNREKKNAGKKCGKGEREREGGRGVRGSMEHGILVIMCWFEARGLDFWEKPKIKIQKKFG